jgi:hypothetical protein
VNCEVPAASFAKNILEPDADKRVDLGFE